MAHVFGTSRITHSEFVYTSSKRKSLNHKVGLISCYNVKNQSSSYLSIHNGTCFWHVKNRSLRIRSHQFETRVTKSQSLFNSLLQRQKTIIRLSVNAFCTSRITYSKLVYTSSKHKSLNHKVGLIHCYNDKNQSSSYLSNTVTHGFWYVKNHSPKIRLHTFETQVGLKLF